MSASLRLVTAVLAAAAVVAVAATTTVCAGSVVSGDVPVSRPSVRGRRLMTPWQVSAAASSRREQHAQRVVSDDAGAGGGEGGGALAVMPYKVEWFDQVLDHFSFTSSQTFKQRWLINDDYFDPSSPRVLFYTGNEGDITLFWQNTGFVTAYLGQKLRATVIFVEHRYFGETMPFGKASLEPQNLKYLSAEQALADYAHFVTELRRTANGLKDAAFITFGGSYGGMLAGWARIKYPWVFQGAIAASAPVAEFASVPGYSQWGFNEIITQDFAQTQFGGATCADRMRDGFKELMELGKTAAGRLVLEKTYKPCTSLKTQADVDALYAWLDNGFAYECMADYPAPANFLEPMPAYPVNVSCDMAQQAFDRKSSAYPLQDALMAAVSVYYNWTGTAGQCMNMSVYSTGALGMTAWDYLACTEMAFPISSNGTSDMFLPSYFDEKAYAAGCKQQFGVQTRPRWASLQWGGNMLQSGVSNIVFSNGELDPWRSGGVTTPQSDTVHVVVIQGGAHHLDMRTPNAADPPSCVAARKLEEQSILKWIAEHEANVARRRAHTEL